MNDEREVRQERSIPVQSRIDMISLARLDVYWSKEGYNVKSMSQLVSWSIDLLIKVLEANGVDIKIDTLVDADRYLNVRGLHQAGMRNKRGREKLATALRFESIRLEGSNPKDVVPRQYNELHRKDSVQPFEGEAVNEKTKKINEITRKALEVDEIARIKNDEKEVEEGWKRIREHQEKVRDGNEEVEESQGSKFDNVGSIPERDREVIEQENELDMEFLKSKVVKE